MNIADGWKVISFTFTPTVAYEYAAIGIRPGTLKLKDPNLKAAYVLIDGLYLNVTCDDECEAVIEPVDTLCISTDPIKLEADPGVGTWTGPGVSTTGMFDPSVAGEGTHQIIFTVEEGCADTVEIVVENGEDVMIDPVGPFCLTDDLALLNASPKGGIWTGSGVQDNVFNPEVAEAGIHKIEYTLTGGTCPGYASLDVFVGEIPALDISVNKSGCLPVNAMFSYTSSDVLYNCEWTFGDEQIFSCNPISKTFYQPGCFDVTFSGESAIGCRVEKTVEKIVCVDSMPVANFEASSYIIDVENTNVTFTNLSKNSTSYLWGFAGLDQSTEENTAYQFPSKMGNYNVCLTASNSVGCKDSICKNIKIESNLSIFVPNIFTPNDDGYNDFFIPVIGGYENIKDYHFQIFNRWGEMVFQTKEVQEGWSGLGKSEQIDAVYVWRVKLTDNKGKKYNRIGHVALVK